MYTATQARQVKQIFIKTMQRFPTEEDMQRIYDADFAEFQDFRSNVNNCAQETTFDEYCGDMLEDELNSVVFACLIEDTIAA